MQMLSRKRNIQTTTAVQQAATVQGDGKQGAKSNANQGEKQSAAQGGSGLKAAVMGNIVNEKLLMRKMAYEGSLERVIKE